MTNETEIQNRLTAIRVLESLKVNIVVITDDGYRNDIKGTKLNAECIDSVVAASVDNCNAFGRTNELSGKLVEAVAVINRTIKEQLAPLIAEHKAKIKELL